MNEVDALAYQKCIKTMKEWAGFPNITDVTFMIWFKHYLDAARALTPYPKSLQHIDTTFAIFKEMGNASLAHPATNGKNLDAAVM